MPEIIKGLPLAVSIVEFIGSLSSFLGASFILVCYMILPVKRHFRHTLILNLAVADAVNGLCNALSGLQVLIHRHDLKAGVACTINGLIGQMTVQGTDTAIFAIALVTVYTITRRTPVQAQWSWRAVFLTWLSIWALPFTTSFTALGMRLYGPVSGNWCWLVDKPIYMRYVLTHGWRFLFIFLEIGLYLYLHFYLQRHFKNLGASLSDTEASASRVHTSRSQVVIDVGPNHGDTFSDLPLKQLDSIDGQDSLPKIYNISESPIRSKPQQPRSPPVGNHKASNVHIMAHRREGEVPVRNQHFNAIERVLLLNAYPLLYITLWLPGLANRLVEASGHTSKVTQVMQLSTQFVGLANAITFGWNEEVARQVRKRSSRL